MKKLLLGICFIFFATSASAEFSTAYINFGPENMPAVEGYSIDHGELYEASRGYGWTKEIENVQYLGSDPDDRRNSRAFVNYWESSTWQYDLPNGNYLVTFSVGDAWHEHGPHTVSIEGDIVVDDDLAGASGGNFGGPPITDYPVTVSDGKLSVKLGPDVYPQDARGHRINYIVIKEDTDPGDGSNQSPTVDVGDDLTIVMPNGVNLNANLTDDADIGDLSLIWSQISGPVGGAVFSSTSVVNPTVTFNTAGIYLLRLKASDGQNNATDDVSVTVTSEGGSAGYFEVKVNFGASNTPAIDGYILDQGELFDSSKGYGWSNNQVATKYIGNDSDERRNSAAIVNYWESSTWEHNVPNGDYLVSFSVGDAWHEHGPHTVFVENNIVVDDDLAGPGGGYFGPPIVDHPVTVTDGKISLKLGPDAVPTDARSHKINYVVIRSASGDAPDNPINQAPMVNAGDDQSVTLPNTIVISAVVSDDGQSAPDLTWSQIGGPALGASFSDPKVSNPTVIFSQPGSYSLRLTADDGEKSTTDDVVVSVNAEGDGEYFEVKVNFGASNTPTIDGYILDEGELFSTTKGYGWSTSNVRTKYIGSDPDERRNSAAIVGELLGECDVEHVVPNGDYLVSFSVGDAWHEHGPHTVAVENSIVVDDDLAGPGGGVFGPPIVDHPVTVTDGKISIKLGPDAVPTDARSHKINYVVIRSASGDAPDNPTNQAPMVNAGDDQVIILPDGVNLDGVVNDDGQSSVALTWAQTGGPASGSDIVTGSAEDTAVSFTQPGTYVFRLTADDGTNTAFDEVTVVVNSEGGGNENFQAKVNFGSSDTPEIPGYVLDQGQLFDASKGYGWSNGNVTMKYLGNDPDARRNSAAQVNYWESSTWEYNVPNGEYLVSFSVGDAWHEHGPHTVAIENSIVVNDDLGGPGGGYFGPPVIDHPVTVTDGKISVKLGPDTTPDNSRGHKINYIIIRSAAGGSATNQPPIVSAGSDQITTVSNTALLSGSVVDDLLPLPVNLSISWTKVSGPGNVVFGAAASVVTNASFSEVGLYELRLTGNDGEYSVSDSVNVVVDPESSVPTVGLVAHWKFDETGGPTALESRGSGSDGVLMNMEDSDFVGGQLSNALSFDGADEYVEIGSTPGLVINNEITVAAWVKIDADGYGVIISKHKSGDYGWMLSRSPVDDSFEWRVSTDGVDWNGGTTAANSFEVDQWYYVLASYDGSVMRVFIDGVENTGGSFPLNAPGDLHMSTASMQIGRDEFNGDNFSFSGVIDDVRIYDQTLTDAEILTLYNDVTPGNGDGADKEITFDDNGIPEIWNQNLLKREDMSSMKLEPTQVGRNCFVDGTLGIPMADRISSGDITDPEQMKYTFDQIPRNPDGSYDIDNIKFFKSIQAATNRYSACNRMGDRILVRKGTYHERLTLYEYQNYGGGDVADGYAIGPMDGAFVLDTSDTKLVEGEWEAYNQETFRVKWGLNRDPSWIVMDGNFRSGRPRQSLSAIANNDGFFYYDSSSDYLYVNTGGVHPDERGIILARHDDSNGHMGIISRTENMEWSGFILRGPVSTGLWQTGNGGHVHDVIFEFCGRSCVNLMDSDNAVIEKIIVHAPVMQWWPRGRTTVHGFWPSGSQVGSGGLFQHSLIEYSGGEGIGGLLISDVTYRQNVIRDSWSVNVYPPDNNNVIIEENLIYNSTVDFDDAIEESQMPSGDDVNFLRRRMRAIGIMMGSELDNDPLSSNYTVRRNVIVNGRSGIDFYAYGAGSGWIDITIEDNLIIMPKDNPADIDGIYHGLRGYGSVNDSNNFFTDNIVINPAQTGIIIGRLNDPAIVSEEFTIMNNKWYAPAGTSQFKYRQNDYDYSQWRSATPYGDGSTFGTIPEETTWEINGQRISVPDYIPIK